MANRVLISCLLATISSIPLFAPAALAAATPTDVVLHYTFDQIDGETLGDNSGHGLVGTLKNISQENVVPSETGNALQFNGVNSYVVVGQADSLAFAKGDFTISIWARPTKNEGTVLSMLSDTTSSHGRYQLSLNMGVPVVAYRPTAAGHATLRGVQPLVLGQWHQLVVVFDATHSQISLYVNGILTNQDAWNGSTWGAANQSLYLGAHVSGQVQPSYQGELDELQITASAMTPQRVLSEWTKHMRSVQSKSVWTGSDVITYVVPPMSSTRWLSNVLPSETSISKTIEMIAAKNQFESASFIVYPMMDIQKLEVTVSDLKAEQSGSTIPSNQVDLRIVKRWYQSGNAWDGYPLQNLTNRVLVPELLLHDENMVRVDHKTQDNYLRLDKPEGPEYVSISYKKSGEYQKLFTVQELGAIEFNYATEPVSDAETLQPVAMHAGETRQFWMTLKVPKDAATGRYTGELTLSAEGKTLGTMSLVLRVLPYELPLPRTYYDLTKDYYPHASTHVRYNIEKNLSGSDEVAVQRLRAAYKDLYEHGIYELTTPHFPGEYKQENKDVFVKELTLLKESGMPIRMVGRVDAATYRWWIKSKDQAEVDQRQKEFENKVDTVLQLVHQALGYGPERVWFYGTDEAHGDMLTAQLSQWKYIQKTGAKVYTTGWSENFRTVGFSQDSHSLAGKPDKAAADQWHALGNSVFTYAYPFSGPEEPLLWRRNAGILPYKANYDGFLLYIYYEASVSNIWNDFLPNQYRGLNMVYPTKTGIVGTLAWEGFRVGVDDIRYTTKMKMLAQEAIDSSSIDAKHTAKKALQWLALVDSEQIDLDAYRLEVINHIDKLMAILEKGDK